MIFSDYEDRTPQRQISPCIYPDIKVYSEYDYTLAKYVCSKCNHELIDGSNKCFSCGSTISRGYDEGGCVNFGS